MRWSEAKCKDLRANRQEVIDCSAVAEIWVWEENKGTEEGERAERAARRIENEGK